MHLFSISEYNIQPCKGIQYVQLTNAMFVLALSQVKSSTLPDEQVFVFP